MSGPIRVLVTGGRDYDDRNAVYASLDRLYEDEGHRRVVIIQGGASGADLWARRWASMPNFECLTFPADWTAHGRAAGPLRNARMIAEGRPDLVVAFPGGRSTADCVRKARAAGVPVREILP